MSNYYQFAVASRSETGRRSANEDSVLVDQNNGLYVVCDGAGGKMGGRVASQMLCRALEEYAQELSSRIGDEISDRTNKAVSAILTNVHAQILEKQRSSPQLAGMATTVAMAVHRGGELLLSHVGDSRIYLFRDLELRQLTRDHSLENYIKDNPDFRPKVRCSPKTLVRAIGMKDEAINVDHRRLALQKDDVVLICSDGLSDSVPSWVMREILAGVSCSSLEEVNACLVRAAISHGSMDNVSVLLLQITDRIEHDCPPTAVFQLAAHGPISILQRLGWLAITEGPKSGQIVPLEGSTVIGADPGCRIVLNDGYVSGHHCEVMVSQHGFWLQDLGSTNGTYINNLKVAPKQEISLVDGDIIRVGSTEMTFKSHTVD